MRLKIRNTTRINATGKTLYKFINLLHENGIECRNEYCHGTVLSADILSHDLKAVEEVAADCGIELKTAAYDSISARLLRYRKRTGLLIGLALAVIAAIYFARVIVTIEVTGNTCISDEIILSALGELDVKKGTPIYKLDLQKCADRLPFMIDGVAWAGVHRTGNRIAVQIRESAPIPQNVRGRVPCNIVAAHDAEITSVLVRSGMLMHIIGDYVPKGTILVSGVSQSEKGRISAYHAMGEIRGTYAENVCFSAAFKSEERSLTGRTDTQRTLSLFSLDIPLYFGNSNYSRRISNESERPLILFGKKLPVAIKRREVSEISYTEKEYSAEELTSKLMERVELYEKNFLSDGTVILSRDISQTVTDESLTLNVSYKLEGNIGEEREIFIK